ncbi:7846_t:CDS:1, partial [Gigaspora rosea]
FVFLWRFCEESSRGFACFTDVLVEFLSLLRGLLISCGLTCDLSCFPVWWSCVFSGTTFGVS